jgi:hypothetical protein
MIKDTCLFPLDVAQSLQLQSPGDSHTTGHLINITSEKQAIQVSMFLVIDQ